MYRSRGEIKISRLLNFLKKELIAQLRRVQLINITVDQGGVHHLLEMVLRRINCAFARTASISARRYRVFTGHAGCGGFFLALTGFFMLFISQILIGLVYLENGILFILRG